LKLADFLATAQVPDEEVKKAYEAQKARLLSEEQRKVKFVAFVLPTTDKPLTGKDRVDALTALSKKAEDFSVAMTNKDAKLEEVAAKFDAKVEESPEFTRSTPPESFADPLKVANAAFKLTDKDPNSDVIDTERGYYVLQLAGVTAPRQLTFEEVQGRLTEEMKRDRAREALDLKAKEIRNKIEADLKAGKSFADAATAAGVTVEKFPAFSRREPQIDKENAGEIMDAASTLAVGQLSAVVPTEADSLLVHVDGRPPIDEEKYKAERPRIVESVVQYQQAALFQEWLKSRRAAAQVKTSLRG
jgi:peptidyl-prolyl cis-trans isomerase D